VVAGVVVVASARRTESLWALTHDLSAGVVLSPGDLRAVSARLPSSTGSYFSSRTVVVGQTMTKDVRAGELLPRSAVGPTAARTTVSIPLGADVAPEIKPGQRITLWVSTKTCPSATVLSDTAVQDVQESRGGGLGSSGGQTIVVQLSPSDAKRVIEALALKDATIRAGIRSGPSQGTEAPGQLSACADSTS